MWYFLIDSLNGWYDAQIAAGHTPEQINEYLSQFDVWDRYDYNGNGNFDEPDGYIDTFQSVHAGIGNESCSPACDDWAIWSHSWYAFSSRIGQTGPDFNKYGGVQVGDSDYWVGKYTIQPENGGVGVFVHEFGHDLGLPDLYDTSGGENGTGFWTLMSSGSWMDDGKDTIGNKSSHMGAWEKFQLGWLNHEVAYAGQKSEHKLGPINGLGLLTITEFIECAEPAQKIFTLEPVERGGLYEPALIGKIGHIFMNRRVWKVGEQMFLGHIVNAYEVPLLIEGVLQGLAGAGLAVAVLVGLQAAVAPPLAAAAGMVAPLARAEVLPGSLVAALLGGGAALGLLASALAVGRWLRRV